jgi:hypothetical protein
MNTNANSTDPTTPEGAFQYFLTKAPPFDSSAVLTFRSDPHLAQHNVLRGLEAVLEQQQRIAQELPFVELDLLRELTSLSHAVIFAAARVNRTPEATMLRELMPEAYQLRRKLLASAMALAEAGLIPEREVRTVEKGRGQIDVAGDLTLLPPLYRRHQEAIAGKHPVSKADLDRAEQLGQQLLEILRPGAATGPRNVSPELVASVEARDRLWTLLVTRYELLWRTGAWLFGQKVDEKVPPLQSRRIKRKGGDGDSGEPETPTE